MIDDESTERGFSGYASDIWAVGVCLYIFVLGSAPFKGGGDEGVLLCFEAIKTQDPCASLPSSVSEPCASLMRALLTKDWKVSEIPPRVKAARTSHVSRTTRGPRTDAHPDRSSADAPVREQS